MAECRISRAWLIGLSALAAISGHGQAVAATPAVAAAYRACDGYGAPLPSGDAMTKMALAGGIFYTPGDRRRATPAMGLAGIQACSEAIADLQQFPDYWLRKVSLIRAQALHRMASGDIPGAVKALDDAEQAAVDKSDRYYLRSLKMGIDLSRALALRWQGDQAGAEALAMHAWATRPYIRQSAFAAGAAMGPEASAANTARIWTALAQVAPGDSGKLYGDAFEHGRWEEARALYPGLQPPVQLKDFPIDFREGLMIDQNNRARAEVFWAVNGARQAYVLAALGRPAEARAALAATKARADAATPPAPDLPPDAKVADMTRRAVYEQANLRIKTELPRVLMNWDRLVEARLLLGEQKVDTAAAQLQAASKNLPQTWATVDAFQALAAQDHDPNLARQATTLREELLKLRKPALALDVKTLFESLPETETVGRLGKYRHQSEFRLKLDGYRDKPSAAGGGATTVEYRAYDASLSINEEEALLRAAQLALQAGKTALVVVGRKDIAESGQVTTYGVAGPAMPTGYGTQLDVVFFDPAGPPSDYRNAAWRILDAKTVYAALAPTYAPAGVPGTP